MIAIDPTFVKQDMEMIAHIIDKLPNEYSKVVTTVEGTKMITLPDLKLKIRASGSASLRERRILRSWLYPSTQSSKAYAETAAN